MQKKNRGITLIALIITIIVLLILAVVTISAVNEGSLFAHANNAASAYNQSAIEENAVITNAILTLDDYANRIKQSETPQADSITLPSVIGVYIISSTGKDIPITVGEGLQGKEITYSGYDTSICTIENGAIHPVAEGTITITATCDGKTATATIKVTGNIWKDVYGLNVADECFNVEYTGDLQQDGGTTKEVTYAIIKDGSFYNNETPSSSASASDIESIYNQGLLTSNGNTIIINMGEVSAKLVIDATKIEEYGILNSTSEEKDVGTFTNTGTTRTSI